MAEYKKPITDYQNLVESELVETDYVIDDQAGETNTQNSPIAESGFELLRKRLLKDKYGTKLLEQEAYRAQVIQVIDINAEKEKPKFQVIAYVFSLDTHVPETYKGAPITPSYILQRPDLMCTLSTFTPKDINLKKPAVGQIIFISYADAYERTNPLYLGPAGVLKYDRYRQDITADPLGALEKAEETMRNNIQKGLDALPGNLDKTLNKGIEGLFGEAYAAAGVDIPEADTFKQIANSFNKNTNNRTADQKKGLLGNFIKDAPSANLFPESEPVDNVLDAAYAFKGGPYGAPSSGFGVPIDIWFKDFYAKKAQSITSFGFTWTVMFTLANSKKKLDNFSGGQVGNTLDFWRKGNFGGNVTVAESLSLGYEVKLEQCAPGDFIQFLTTDTAVDNKFSAIFLNWITTSAGTVGFRCRSSFKSSNGISDKDIYFNSIDQDSFTAFRMRY